MAKKKAIESLLELSLNWRDLDSLSKDEKAALAVVSYAASELNILARLYIFSMHEPSNSKSIDTAAAMQRHLLLRSWSARIFEFYKFIGEESDKPSCDDEALQKLFQDSNQSFETLKRRLGFEIARDLRNEATNHYSLKAAKKNLASVPCHADCSFYLHEIDGNSFYPMGEEVMFIGRMNRKGKSVTTENDRAALFNEWMGWNLDANRWVKDTHVSFADRIFISKTDKRATKMSHWIPYSMVGDKDAFKIPVLLRK